MKLFKVSLLGLSCAALLSACGQSQSQQSTVEDGNAQLKAGPSIGEVCHLRQERTDLTQKYACGHDGDKVMICHKPKASAEYDKPHESNDASRGSSNHQYGITLCVARPALKAHLAEHKGGHSDDYLGPCVAPGDDNSGGDDGTVGGDTGSGDDGTVGGDTGSGDDGTVGGDTGSGDGTTGGDTGTGGDTSTGDGTTTDGTNDGIGDGSNGGTCDVCDL